LVEGELKDAQHSARKERESLLQQVESLERHNLQMRAGAPAAMADDKMRPIIKERDDLRMRFDDLQSRHTSLQHKMQSMGPVGAVQDTSSTSAIGKKLQESEAKASALISQKQQLLKENEILRNQVLQEVANVEAEKQTMVQQTDEIISKYQTDLQAARAEVLELKRRLIQLETEGGQEQAKAATRLSQENGELTRRIYDLEHQNALLSRQLSDSEAKSGWLQEQVSVKDSTLLTLSNMHSSKLDKRKEVLITAAKRTLRSGSMRRALTAWFEQARNSAMRANSAAESLARKDATLMRACLDEWSFHVRDGARQKREAMLHDEFQARAKERELEIVKSLSEQYEQERQGMRQGSDTHVTDLKSKIEELSKEMAIIRIERGNDATLLRAEYTTREDAAKAAHEEMVRVIHEEHAALVKALQEKHAESVRVLKEEHRQNVNKIVLEHQDTIQKMSGEHSASLSAIRDRQAREMANLEASATAESKEASRSLKEKMGKADAEFAKQVAELKAANEANEARRAEELQSAHRRFDQALKAMRESAISIEAELRDQLVAVKKSADETYEQLLAKQSETDRDWRRRILDKERELALQLEEAEASRLQAVEDGEQELKELQRESDRKMDEMRQEHTRSQDELRQRMQKREKELSHRIETLRSESIKTQEGWQVEMQEKEQEFRSKLEAKEAAFKSHLDSLISNRTTGAVRELSVKLEEAEKALLEQDAVAAQFKGREVELKGEVEAVHERLRQAVHEVEDLKSQQQTIQELRDREGELSNRLEETNALLSQSQVLQSSLVKQFEASQGEAEDYKARIVQNDELCQQLDKELRNERVEKASLARELKEASQALLKRGDDFSESVRLLQGRLEASDGEMRELQERLMQANNTNARLAAELEEASLSLGKHDPGEAHTDRDEEIRQLRTQLHEVETRVHESEQGWQQKMHTARTSQAALEEAHTAAQRDLRVATEKLRHAEQDCASLAKERDDALATYKYLASSGDPSSSAAAESQQRLVEVEDLLEQTQRQMSRVERENTTLTQELDNVLMENAQLRQDLDNEREHREAGNGYDDAPSESGSPISKRLNQFEQVPSWARQLSGGSGHFLPFRREGVTLGVHTIRLLRASFLAWQNATVDMRMVGKTTSFSGLEHFTQQDGSLAEWFPCGRLRRHEIEIKNEKLGSGTFAEVFRGEWRIPVAVKRMRGPMGQKELTEFIREGEMVRTLSHPNVVKLIGVHTDGQNYSLIQEIVTGCNLFDYLHKYHKTVPIGKQLSVALQICDAMCFIHEHRIVHRDVKPQNVIYKEKSGTAKLCDFGLARLMPMGMTELHPSQLGTGGTPAYQGPEVLKRHPVGMKLDLYGFAVTLWEMYTCLLPWSDCNLEQMTTRVALKNERPPMPLEMPREYSDIISRSWATDPQSRPDFNDLLPQLRDLHDALNPPVRGVEGGGFLRGHMPPSPHGSQSSLGSHGQRGMADRSYLGSGGLRSSGSGRPEHGGMSNMPQFPGHPNPGSYPTSYGAF